MSPELWSVFAHDDGVYSVDLNDAHVASGGEEGGVRVWGRADGALLSTLCHHDYIVWNVSFWLDRLFTCSYDCTVAYLTPRVVHGRIASQVRIMNLCLACFESDKNIRITSEKSISAKKES